MYKTLEAGHAFELSRLEKSLKPYDASAPHRHNYFEVLFFAEGGGFHEVDFDALPVEAASLHFVTPGQVHVLHRDNSVTGYVLAFSHDFFADANGRSHLLESLPFFENPFARPVVSLSSPMLEDAESILKRMHAEYQRPAADSNDLLRAYLSALLVLARRAYEPAPAPGKLSARAGLTHKFKKLVENHFRQCRSVSEYAAKLSITAGHLNDSVQQESGKTASEIIYERIVLEAKRMLYHSPASIKEIAFELNYEDPSHFTRFFRTHAGISPDQFRRQIREKYQ